MIRFLKVVLYLIFVMTCGYAQAAGQWQLVSEKSRLDFMGKTTLHNFNGSARKLSGTMEQNLNLARGFIDVDVAGLTTEEPDRDQKMYQMFNVNLSPQIHFVFNDTDITGVLKDHDGEIQFAGVMTIHNVSRPVTLISKGHMQEDTLMCEGQMRVHLKEYGLKPPSVLGIIRVRDRKSVV